MSTFYVLPQRETVTSRLSATMTAMVGTQPTQSLADRFAALVEQPPEVFVVFADDLPDETEPELAGVLCELFGADPGDEVIDLRAA